MDSAKQLISLKERIEYEEIIFGNEDTYTNLLNRLLKDSNLIGLSLRYPYKDYSEMSLPSKYSNWQLRCCVELYQQIGNEGVKSYAENGLSWTRDSGYISNELRGEIEPLVGYIIAEEE